MRQENGVGWTAGKGGIKREISDGVVGQRKDRERGRDG